MPYRAMARPVTVAAACAMLVAGCTQGSAPDVASTNDMLASGTAQSPTPDDGEVAPAGGGSASSDSRVAADASQRERAEEFYSCLVAADIDVSIEDYDDDQAIVQIEGDNSYGVTSDGTAWVGRQGLSEDSLTRFNELRERVWGDRLVMVEGESTANMDEARMIVGDADVTEPFEACLAASGYTVPEWSERDPAEQLLFSQRIADAGNAWAACARENGVPTVKDVTASSDPDYTPMVLLPTTITADQLRVLVEACPTFDHDAELAYADQMMSGDLSAAELAELEYPAKPEIGFDAPGWNGDLNSEEGVDPTVGDDKRLADLQEILLRPYSDFLEQEVGGVG
ncbi:MAG: hypothetical protein LBK59_01660 [Bifidobacteriaceae bacterium]|jgi:hypothetical protein|nr:hypothetical protein [Bifidobacteriaceae bacterium]